MFHTLTPDTVEAILQRYGRADPDIVSAVLLSLSNRSRLSALLADLGQSAKRGTWNDDTLAAILYGILMCYG